MGGERRKGCPRNRHGSTVCQFIVCVRKAEGSDCDCDKENNIPLKQDQTSTKRRTAVWSERDSKVRLSGASFRPSTRRLPASLVSPLAVDLSGAPTGGRVLSQAAINTTRHVLHHDATRSDIWTHYPSRLELHTSHKQARTTAWREIYDYMRVILVQCDSYLKGWNSESIAP